MRHTDVPLTEFPESQEWSESIDRSRVLSTQQPAAS